MPATGGGKPPGPRWAVRSCRMLSRDRPARRAISAALTKSSGSMRTTSKPALATSAIADSTARSRDGASRVKSRKGVPSRIPSRASSQPASQPVLDVVRELGKPGQDQREFVLRHKASRWRPRCLQVCPDVDTCQHGRTWAGAGARPTSLAALREEVWGIMAVSGRWSNAWPLWSVQGMARIVTCGLGVPPPPLPPPCTPAPSGLSAPPFSIEGDATRGRREGRSPLGARESFA